MNKLFFNGQKFYIIPFFSSSLYFHSSFPKELYPDILKSFINRLIISLKMYTNSIFFLFCDHKAMLSNTDIMEHSLVSPSPLSK